MLLLLQKDAAALLLLLQKNTAALLLLLQKDAAALLLLLQKAAAAIYKKKKTHAHTNIHTSVKLFHIVRHIRSCDYTSIRHIRSCDYTSIRHIRSCDYTSVRHIRSCDYTSIRHIRSCDYTSLAKFPALAHHTNGKEPPAPFTCPAHRGASAPPFPLFAGPLFCNDCSATNDKDHRPAN